MLAAADNMRLIETHTSAQTLAIPGSVGSAHQSL